MKRIAILILSALLLFSALPGTGTAASITYNVPDSDALSANYTPQELSQLWTQIKTMLLINGSYPFSELEKGDTGYEVTALQTQLAALGYYQKEIVDNFGNGTYNAMRSFETEYSLDVNGVASAADQQLLYSIAVTAPETTVQNDGLQLDSYTPEALLELWYQIGDLLRADGSYPFFQLEKGNTGYEVIALQTRLFELGYYEKEVVDYYGNGTYNALRAFEKAFGLTADGIASAEDQQALYSSEAAALTNSYSTNTNSNAPGSNVPDAVSSATPSKP